MTRGKIMQVLDKEGNDITDSLSPENWQRYISYGFQRLGIAERDIPFEKREKMVRDVVIKGVDIKDLP
jgi:hypothetical protein